MFRRKKYRILQRKLEVEIPKELINLWKTFENVKLDEKLFNFKGFGTFQFLTPNEILDETFIIPNNLDEVSFLNACYFLKEEGKITEKHDNFIRSNSKNDLLLISYDFRNNLIKKINPNFEIKYTIPFARNLINGREYLFLGFTESKKLKGVYLFATNEYHSEYPIFIHSVLSNIVTGERLKKYNSKEIFDSNKVIINKISDKYRFKIKNFFIYPNIEEYVYDYDAYEAAKEIDRIYLKKYLNFLSIRLKETMGKKNKIEIINDRIKFSINKSGMDFEFSISFKSLENSHQVINRINSELNRICHFNQRFRPENYGFYNFKDYTGCINVNEAIELLKLGILDREIFHSLPLRAFTPSKPKKLNPDLMKLIENEDWDENTIQTFLNDFS